MDDETGRNLEAEILAASQPLATPGIGPSRVLTPLAVQTLARSSGCRRWQVEALALRCGVRPLAYLRNLAGFGEEGQIRLLHSRIVVAGRGPVLARTAELLAGNGVGRIAVRVPLGRNEEAGAARKAGEQLLDMVQRRNPSSETDVEVLSLREGDPRTALGESHAVVASLESAQEEQLLQFTCRLLQVPLVLGAAAAQAGQALVVFPGDPGVALVYRPEHPHLEKERRGSDVDDRAALMVGNWMAEQTTCLLLDQGELIQGRLLYADLEAGEMAEYPLARPPAPGGDE